MVPLSSSTPLKVSVSRPRPSFDKLLVSVSSLSSSSTRSIELCSNSRFRRKIFSSHSREQLSPSTSSSPPTSTRLLVMSQVFPDKGTIAFGSGLHGWAFTVRQFAIRYAKKFGVDKNKMMERLWGDNYFNPKTKKWTKVAEADGKPLERSFNMFILDPIFKIFDAFTKGKVDDLVTMCARSSTSRSPQKRRRCPARVSLRSPCASSCQLLTL